MNTISFIMDGSSEWMMILLLVLPSIFWVWSIIDCTKHEPAEGNDRLVWLIVIFLIGIIGSLTYCLVRRPVRIREHGQ